MLQALMRVAAAGAAVSASAMMDMAKMTIQGDEGTLSASEDTRQGFLMLRDAIVLYTQAEVKASLGSKGMKEVTELLNQKFKEAKEA